MQKERIKAKVADLILNEGQLDWLPENPRQWTREDLELTKASLLRDPDFQEDNPLKVVALPDGKLLVFAGNLRTSAAREVKWKTFEAMLYTPEGPEDEETIRRRALLDNGSFGSWDYDRLADSWSDMPFKELGIKVWDAPQEETPAPAQAQEDDFDETADAVETRCKTGDIWQLGDHRLMCGDSTDAAQVALLMNGERADIAFTSPPYNASYINQENKPTTHKKYIHSEDNRSGEEFLKFLCVNLGILLKHADETFYNIGLVSGNKREIFQLVNAYLDKFKDIIYWKKNIAAPVIQPGVVNNLVEFILAFGENGTRRFKNAQFSQGTFWNVIEGDNAHDNEYSDVHKATFPVYLPAKIVEMFTPPGGSVLDCFGGTGTTMIAAEQLGRKCFMMELDSHYCDIILARWEKLTGQTAHKID